MGWRRGGVAEEKAAEGSGDAMAFVDAAAAIKEWRGAVLGWGDGGSRAPSLEEFLEQGSVAWDGDAGASKRRRRKRGEGDGGEWRRGRGRGAGEYVSTCHLLLSEINLLTVVSCRVVAGRKDGEAAEGIGHGREDEKVKVGECGDEPRWPGKGERPNV